MAQLDSTRLKLNLGSVSWAKLKLVSAQVCQAEFCLLEAQLGLAQAQLVKRLDVGYA